MFDRSFEVDLEMIEVADDVGLVGSSLIGCEMMTQSKSHIADNEWPLRLVAQEGQSLDDVVDHVLEQEVIALRFRDRPPAYRLAALDRKDRRWGAAHRKLLPLRAESCKHAQP